MNKDDQYLELCETVKCTVAPSRIHGVGVFALRDIKKGERMYIRWTTDMPSHWYTLSYSDLSRFDRSYPEIKEIILARYPCVINNCQFLSPNYDAKMICFVNHSDTPNYNELTDIALKDISKGEEVCEDYKRMANWEKVFSWLARTHTG